MLRIQLLIISLILGTVQSVIRVHADEPQIPETNAQVKIAEKATDGPAPSVIDAIIPLMKGVEMEAALAEGSVEIKELTKFYPEARALLEAGRFSDAKTLLLRTQENNHPASQIASIVIPYISGKDDQDAVAFRTLRVRNEVAHYSFHRGTELLTSMNLKGYLIWANFAQNLHVKPWSPDAEALAELVQVELAEHPSNAPLPAGDLKQTVVEFNQQIQGQVLKGLGGLVAQAIRLAPKSAEAERMKLRFILRYLILLDPEFLTRKGSVETLASQFTSAARRRMALGEFESARLLAVDSLPLNIALSATGDSPAKVLADIQSSQAANPTIPARTSGSKAAPADATVSTNLLSNSSMEEGDDAPAHWQQGKPVDSVEFFWDKNNGFQGKASLGLKKTANRYFPITEWHQAIEWSGESSLIHVTSMVKAEGLAKAVLDVAFLDAQGTWLEHKWVAYIGEMNGGPPITHDWKEYQGDVQVPSGTKKVQIGLQIYGPGKVWFDNVRVNRVAPNLDNNQTINAILQDRFVAPATDPMLPMVKPPLPQPPIETELPRQNEVKVTPKRKPDAADEQFERETRKLAAQIREAMPKGQATDAFRKKLEQTVASHFRHRQERRKQEIDDLAHRVDQMRAQHQRREERQPEILNSRLKELLEEDRDLKWDEAQQKQPLKLGPAERSVAALTPQTARPVTQVDEAGIVGTRKSRALQTVEPTYDGISYSAWMKTLASDRSPRKVREALNALRQMLTEEDAQRLARGFFQAMRPSQAGDKSQLAGLGIAQLDSNTKQGLVLASLNDLPAEAVVSAMIEEIRHGLNTSDTQVLISRILLQAFAIPGDHPNEHQPFNHFKGPLTRRGKEILEAVVAANPQPFLQMLSPTINILRECHLKVADVEGLSPLMADTLQLRQKTNEEIWISLIFSMAQIDREFSSVQAAATPITQKLRQHWDSLLGDSLLKRGATGESEQQVGAYDPDGKLTMYPSKFYNVSMLIAGLGKMGPTANQAIPLLKEIGSTDFTKMDYFQGDQAKFRDELKRFVTIALESIEQPK